MKRSSTRRDFLSLGIVLPAAGIASSLGLSKQSGESASPPVPASSPKLTYRTLGKTGLKVTTLGFGCMITSDPSVVERAADLGINYFDTARGYQGGNNERMVGAALKARRKQVFISSKSHGGSKQEALDNLETSLRELGTDYLDVWYLHGRSSPREVTDELIEAQQLAKQQGKTRFVGISTHSGQPELIPWMVKKGVFDVVLAAYNFTMDPGMGTVLEEASQAGLGIVAMKVMAGGFRRLRPGSPLYPKMKQEGAMLAALKWVVKNPSVHTTVPSMTDMDQLDENLRAMAEPYSPAEEKLLARQLDYISPLYCRMCGQCTGSCAKGLPVADMLRFLTYAEGYGQFSLGREEFLQLPAEALSVRCSECSSCTVTCPFGVNVASRLSRAQELFA
jgi:predicted aldo/keto reductase-like oxidoreductase